MSDEDVAVVEAYGPCEVNGSLLLRQDLVEITTSRTPVRGNADIVLRLSPTPAIQIDCHVQEASLWAKVTFALDPMGEDDQVRLVGQDVTAPVLVTKKSTEDGLRVEAVLRREPLKLPAFVAAMRSVTFHLVNYRPFRGQRMATLAGSENQVESVIFRGGGWVVRLNEVEGLRRRVEAAKETVGYAITHVGSAEREDQQLFSSREAEDLLTDLHFFFSFARGSLCDAAVPVGFNDHGARIWELWASGRADRWSNHQSWCDPDDLEALPRLFPLFLERMGEEENQKALRTAIYWYARANNTVSGTDTAVILAHTALELLAWLLLVNEAGALSQEGFRNLPASDKIRLLVAHIGVSPRVPPAFTHLDRALREPGLNDGPAVLSDVRNSIVHPTKKKRTLLDSDVFTGCWKLALHYVELALLYHLGYQEEYVNRLTARLTGEREQVPWATPSRPGALKSAGEGNNEPT